MRHRTSVSLLLLILAVMLSSVSQGFSSNSTSVSYSQARNASDGSMRLNEAAMGTKQVSYHGGVVFSNSFLYVVFWGDDWNNNTQMLQRIYNSIRVLIESGYFNGLDQYGYGAVSLIGYTTNHIPLAPGQVSDATFMKYIKGLTASGTIPKYYSQVMFVLPPRQDVWGYVTRDKVYGYHSGWLVPIGNGVSMPTGYSVIQTATDYSQQSFNYITVTISHELVETITDPYPGRGWFGSNATSTEVADLCNNNPDGTQFGGVQVAYYWSNSTSNCVVSEENGLQAVSLASLNLPNDQCAIVTWTTNLLTLRQPDCETTRFTVRAVLGSLLSVSPTIFTDPSTRYVSGDKTNQTISPGLMVSVEFVKQYYVAIGTNQFNLITVPGTGWYASGSRLQLVAPQVNGFSFVAWVVNSQNMNANPLTIVVDQPINITAMYQSVPQS